MKKKYLAYCMALTMALTTAAPVAAAEQVEVAAEASGEETFTEPEETQEDGEIITEEATETAGEEFTDQTVTDNLFNDGSEDVNFAGEGDDQSDDWVKMSTYRPSDYGESTIEARYDEKEQTLYLRCSKPEAMQDIGNSIVTPWYLYLKEKNAIKDVKKIVIGEGITRIGNKNFNTIENVSGMDFWDSLEEIVLPSTVTEIGEEAFASDAALKKINFDNVSLVGRAAFSGTGLENVTFNTDKVTLKGNAFAGCEALTTVKLKQVELGGNNIFYRCTALKSFEYDGELESIPDYTFNDCTALTSFDFKNVKKIGYMSFADSVKNGCYGGTREEWKAIMDGFFFGGPGFADDIVIHCKGDSIEAKEATCTESGWKEVGTCEVCGAHYSYEDDENVLSALGHAFADTYTVDREATCTEAGEQSKHCTREGCEAREDVQVIEAAGHKWSEWKKKADATVFAPAQQTRKCSVCGKEETKTTGKKLTPKASVNASTVTLKVKQSTSGLKVTGLAKGDSVKSWNSTNKKIFTVSGKTNGTCKITAKKKGTAKLEITLKSGLKKTVKIKVQTTAVQTAKLTGLKNSLNLKKGQKTTLKPAVVPFTSAQKITYASSNKKVATVSSRGVVTAKKKGTVKITVRSGKKSYVVKVKVK